MKDKEEKKGIEIVDEMSAKRWRKKKGIGKERGGEGEVGYNKNKKTSF